MTNRQIHDTATPFYGAAKRIGYFVRWHYDVTVIAGQRTTLANGSTVRYEADCTGTMPLAVARKLARSIAATPGFHAITVCRVIDPQNRFMHDEFYYEPYGSTLTDAQYFETVRLTA